MIIYIVTKYKQHKQYIALTCNLGKAKSHSMLLLDRAHVQLN